MQGNSGIRKAYRILGKVGVILLAAGKGERFGGLKQFEKLNDKQIIDITLEKYLFADEIHVMVPRDIAYYRPENNVAVLPGGETRFDSIKAGFFPAKFKDFKILIADASRPFTKESMIHEIVEALDDYEAACPGIPAFETVCRVKEGRITEVYDRIDQYFNQTPIGYRAEVLNEIFTYANTYNEKKGFNLCHYIWKYGLGKVKLIEGDPENFKITYKKDLIHGQISN